eukprot:GEMP01062817.1.p1 GENE.GEMP01062817.1~~GEMP01062817.1.p1  ORF type:complete len:239 (+),score=47.23 GEMP01062817.1:130-846(+)
MDPFNKVASLNVGGVRYDVAISTLMKYPNSMLAALVSDRWHGTDGNALHDVDDSDKEPLFIDRDGQRFQHILDFLRDGKCWLPFTTPLEALLSDANFFSIPLNASVVEFQHGLQLSGLRETLYEFDHSVEADLRAERDAAFSTAGALRVAELSIAKLMRSGDQISILRASDITSDDDIWVKTAFEPFLSNVHFKNVFTDVVNRRGFALARISIFLDFFLEIKYGKPRDHTLRHRESRH